MPQTIQRHHNGNGYPIAVAADVANSTTISMGAASSLAVMLEASPDAAARINWYGSTSTDGPWLQIYLSGEEEAYTAVPAAGFYITPPELFGCAFLRGKSNVGGFSAVAVLKG